MDFRYGGDWTAEGRLPAEFRARLTGRAERARLASAAGTAIFTCIPVLIDMISGIQ